MAKKKPKPAREPDRLKLDIPWDEAAARLLQVPAGSTPERKVKARKKSEKKS